MPFHQHYKCLNNSVSSLSYSDAKEASRFDFIYKASDLFLLRGKQKYPKPIKHGNAFDTI